jgi:selenocysteine lyase/cysteine desulfurase
MHRRNFLRSSGAALGLAALFDPLQESRAHAVFPEENSEDLWRWVREQYTVSGNLINLNNGGVSPQPKSVQEAHIRFYQYSNEGPTYYMWRILDQGREALRMRLAELSGCDAEEIAINRNSTEGLNTIIFGLNLKAGDEVVLNRYDYPNMMNAWKQREKRDGIKLNWIEIDFPCEDEDKIVKCYTDAITPNTKVVHITHLINWTGQIMPAKKIAEAARKKGCEVIVDGAHSFAHLEYKIPDLGADYYATSLHKWLCAPFGSGLLYIRKEKIKDVWALLSNDKPDGDNIRKFESLGTRNMASEMAIAQAIDFHLTIGAKRKQQRLHQLKNYWMEKTADLPGIHFATSKNPAYGCAIGHVGFAEKKGAQIESFLLDKFKVHTVAIDYEKLSGIRITPNVYTSFEDLDRLVKGLKEFSKT